MVPVASNGLLELEEEQGEDTDLCDLLNFQCALNRSTVFFSTHDVNSRAAMRGLRSDHQIVPKRFGHSQHSDEHGLKPTRGTSHLVKPRTGNKKRHK